MLLSFKNLHMLNSRSKSLLYINGFLSIDVLYSGIEKKQIFTFTNLPKLLIDVKFLLTARLVMRARRSL